MPDHLAVVQVDHRGQVEPALPRGRVSDAADQPAAPAAQRGDDPRTPTGTPVTGVDLDDPGGQVLVSLGPPRPGRDGGEPFAEVGQRRDLLRRICDALRRTPFSNPGSATRLRSARSSARFTAAAMSTGPTNGRRDGVPAELGGATFRSATLIALDETQDAPTRPSAVPSRQGRARAPRSP
ncbi:hypothetical protein ACFFSW_35160 [Saccharothrix longispora]|uniref:Uncharacterized protein n=1 Tax=Saccharothrix longispora TaxID=33920 RepID=A0ABU1PRZ6_9PSEU|nr:hypothetical protein [Saccharothrix longispora]